MLVHAPIYAAATAAQQPFQFGNALEFDGVNDFCSIGTSISPAGNVSMSIWFKIFSFKSGYFSLLGSTINQNRYLMLRDFGGVFEVAGYYIFAIKSTTEPATLNVWHHLCLVKLGSTVTFYLNGINYGTANVLGNFSFDLIGKYEPTNSFSPCNGVLDEFAWWDTALTNQQALDLWNNGNGQLATDVGSPIHYYRFNGNAGDNVAIDQINGNNALLNNFNTATCWVAH